MKLGNLDARFPGTFYVYLVWTPKRIGNHTLRGTGLTDYMENGGDLEYAQRQAFHESIRTTKMYDHRDKKLSIDEVEKMPSREVGVSG